jgi:RNA polymerase sigma-70 factor (ECF subfamily)
MTNGGDSAFEDWYREAWPKLVGSLVVIVGDRDVAADVAAEAAVRVLERWERGSIGHPTAWAHQVAINLAHRRARREALEVRVLRHGRSAEEVVEPPATPSEVWAALRLLPQRQRTAVALRYLGDLTQAEIAQSMGISPGSVAATLHAARRRLAAMLDLEEDEPRQCEVGT